MKTTVITSGKENATTNSKPTGKTAIRPSVPLKDAEKTEVKEEPKAEAQAPKTQTKTNGEAKGADVANPAPKAEPTKAELKEALQEQKPELNLDATIKIALELNRRINQRGKLIETIDTLEAFEVAQKDDAEETDSNHFQGCELTISDDKDREFTTKNPFIINAVAKMVNTLCVDKLAEIEAEIQFPKK